VTVVADLHNHSCLSPCGDLDNSPRRLCRRAAERGITMLGLTDHNSARNAPAFARCCEESGLIPVFGTETTTREELHILSLFATVEEALDWGEWVYARLPDMRFDPEMFGDQVVVDEDENILDFEPRYLVTAIEASIEEIALETLRRGGLIIPAHIDRSTTSISSQLGFLPDQRFSALEVTRLPVEIDTRGHTLICDSDAHFLDDVGQRTFRFALPPSAPSPFTGLAAALEAGAVSLSIQ
jgi:3',5'-nucleoside bisphosphate phosphatase